MMRNFIIILIVLFIAVFYLLYHNPDPVSFKFGGKEIKTYIPILTGVSFLIGVIFSFLLQLFSMISDWARDTFIKFKTLKERKVMRLLSSAKEAFEVGDIEEALKIAEQCIEMKASSSDVNVFLAKLKIAINSVDDAIRILREEVSKENPPLETVLMYLNLSLKKELPDAIEIGKKKLENDGKYPMLLRVMARACDHDEDLEYQRRLLKINGWDRETERRYYAYLLFRSGEEKMAREDEDGIKLIKKSMELFPFFTPAVSELIKLHVKKGEIKRAKELTYEAFTRNQSHSVLISLEKELLDANQPAEAIEFYNELYEKIDDIDIKFLMVKLFLKLEMIESAEEIMKEFPQEVIDLRPFKYLSAILLAKKKDFPPAYKIVENIMESGCFNLWRCSVCKWDGSAYFMICPSCGSVDTIRMNFQ